jgi:hypothetical protein
MYNTHVCIAVYMVRCPVHASEGQLEGKDVGWNVSSCHQDYKQSPPEERGFLRGCPKMGTEPESVYAQKETMQDVLARCLKNTDPSMYIDQYTCILVKRYSTFFEQYSLEGKYSRHIVQYVHVFITNNRCPFLCLSCVPIITGVYFSQVKNKPWIPWVYT